MSSAAPDDPPASTVAASALHLPLWPLVLITFSGTSAMHMFVPALSVAARELQAGSAQLQLSISIYILGLAVGQLVCGPLSDALGRRPVLLGGLALFTVSGLVAAFAPHVQVLLVARLTQALGGCTGLLLPRAMLRDTAEAQVAVRRLALLNLMTAVGPGLSPLVGGAIAGGLGWRWIFALLTLLGAVNLWLCWRLLPETASPAVAGRRFSAARVASDYARLLRSGRFLAYAVGAGCATTAMYAFIVAAPFIFVEQMHRPVHEVGIYLALMVVGASVGSALAGRLAGRRSVEWLIMRAQSLSLACAVLLLLAVVLPTEPSLWLVVLLICIYAVGAGACGPAVMIQSMGVVPGVAGSAGGFVGCTQMLIGALCTVLAGVGGDPALASALVLLGASVVGQGLLRLATRRAA